MRWIGEGIPASDRWSPVVERYVAQIADRVQGFGGDPTKILPSPTGAIPHAGKHPKKRHELTFTGKVTGLIYDRFGDFEAFILETYNGEHHRFRSREARVHQLVQRAWAERIRTSVVVHRHRPHRPISIVLQ